MKLALFLTVLTWTALGSMAIARADSFPSNQPMQPQPMQPQTQDELPQTPDSLPPRGEASQLQVQGQSVSEMQLGQENSERLDRLTNQINQNVSPDSSNGQGLNIPVISDLQIPKGMVIRGSMGGLAIGTELP
jgi:hypothetical protein